jgi:hypothetical protein
MDEIYAKYENILKLLKEYIDETETEYNFLFEILITRYELTLLKYKMYEDSKYIIILTEIEIIIRWYITECSLSY